MGRAPCCDKANVKKGPWSPEEDACLKDYIQDHGTGGNWIALPQKIGLKRCGKSCRLRWLNYLRPNLKHGGFSEEEDQIICNLYISIGSRWSIIAAQLPGRTDNDIKNYWNTKLKKRILGGGRRSERSQPPRRSMDDNHSHSPEPPSSSTLERLQLHMQLHGPFSFYNNHVLWPNFYPLDGTIQRLQAHSTVDPMITVSSPIEPANETPSEIPNSSLDVSTNRLSGEMSFDNELHGFLNDQNGWFGGQEVNHLIDHQEGMNNWWASHGFDEGTSMSSWDCSSSLPPNSILQEYVSMGYDL